LSGITLEVLVDERSNSTNIKVLAFHHDGHRKLEWKKAKGSLARATRSAFRR